MRISDWSSDVCSSDLSPAPFAGAALAARDDGEQATLTMAELQSFLRNPARGFLRGRLDIVLPYRDDARGGDREPQGDNALLRHQVVSTLLECERDDAALRARRSEEHTSELQSLMRISHAVFCLKKKNTQLNESPKN